MKKMVIVQINFSETALFVILPFQAIFIISEKDVARSSALRASPVTRESEIVQIAKAFLPARAAFIYKAAASISTARTPILLQSATGFWLSGTLLISP